MKLLVPRRQAGLQWLFGHASVLTDSLFAGVTSPHSLSLSLERLVYHVCLLWFGGPSSATAAAGPLWQVGSNWI